MSTELGEAFIHQMLRNPGDLLPWQIYGDWLEEQGDRRAPLLRLLLPLLKRGCPDRERQESLLRELLDHGTPPAAPVMETPTGVLMAVIPPGECWIGSPLTEPRRYGDELLRSFDLPAAFLMGRYVVTQELYHEITGENPSLYAPASRRPREACPVERVSWYDALLFCNQLSRREGLPEYYELQQTDYAEDGSVASAIVRRLHTVGYRLPTDYEWEYACRAGTTTWFHFGNEPTPAKLHYAHAEGDEFNRSGSGRTEAVGQRVPNAFGLYDLHGNVWEWCWDVFEPGNETFPQDLDEETPHHRVVRGGCYHSPFRLVRSASRDGHPCAARTETSGFRLARSVVIPTETDSQ